jgi:hypothetical protein
VDLKFELYNNITDEKLKASDSFTDRIISNDSNARRRSGRITEKEPLVKLDCTACNITFNSIELYADHMCQLHDHWASTIVAKRDKDIIQDFKNSLKYCRSCKRAYKARRFYRNHLSRVHRFILPRIYPTDRDSNVIHQNSNGDIERFCYICQKTYSSDSEYLQHLHQSHEVDIDTETIRSPTGLEIIPDPTDPNQYCQACQTSYSEEAEYLDHARKVHTFTFLPSSDKKALSFKSSNPQKKQGYTKLLLRVPKRIYETLRI